ncbi:ABC transporter permease [Roseivirga echinicomitans]
MNQKTPPFWTRLLKFFCKESFYEELQGDLEESFYSNIETKGVKKAKSIYRKEVFKLFRFSTIKKIKISKPSPNLTFLSLYTKLTFRNMLRHKLFSFITVIGLAAAITVGLFWVNIFYTASQFDRFNEHSASIYRVTTHQQNEERDLHFATTPNALASLIKAEMPYSKKITQLHRFYQQFSIGEEPVSTFGLYADPAFFDIFSFKMIEGNPKTILSEPNSIILTEKAVEKFFPNENPINKVMGDSIQFVVRGIMENPPMKSHLQFEVLVSQNSLKFGQEYSNKETWGIQSGGYTYLLKGEETKEATINQWLNKKSREINALLGDSESNLAFELQPITSITLARENLLNEYGRNNIPLNVVLILLVIVCLILAIAIFNHTSLSIARAIRRSKEIGIRKITGSTSSQIAYQFFIEAIIISFVALLLSGFLYKATVPFFTTLTQEGGMVFDQELSLGLIAAFVAFTLIVGVLAGLFPALYFSKIKVLQAIQNTNPRKVFSFIGLRKTITTVQLTFSLITVLSVSIFGSQYYQLMTSYLGFQTDDILVVESLDNNVRVLSNEFSKAPDIVSIGKSSFIPGRGSRSTTNIKRPDAIDSVFTGSISVDKAFMDMYQIKVILGRNFSTQDKDVQTIKFTLINSNLAKTLGYNSPEDALEQVLKTKEGDVKVIGIIEDFVLMSFYTKMHNTMVKLEPDTEVLTSLSLKLKTDNAFATIASLEKVWEKVDQKNKFKAEFADELVRKQYKENSVILNMIGFLTIIVLAISSLGLLGISLFNAESRSQEISIRKVLGAQVGELIYNLSKGFFISMLIAIAVATPLCYWFFSNIILPQMQSGFTIGIQEIAGAILFLSLVTFTIVWSQTWRVVRLNPSESLRSE